MAAQAASGPKEQPLTEGVLLAASPIGRGRGETPESMLRRVSHLNLQQKKLKTLDGVGQCPNLRTLYAYENELTGLTADFAMTPRLTHLYLSKNMLASLQFLEKASHLQKLYLDGNRLEVVSGLEACKSLVELDVSHQCAEQPLSFDDASLQAISVRRLQALRATASCSSRPARSLQGTLTHLNVAGNELTSTEPLAVLWRLTTLDLSDNALPALEALHPVMQGCDGLQELKASGNPCTAADSAPRRAKVADAIILAAPTSLSVLDGQEISRERRHFLYAREMKRQGLPMPGARAHQGADAAGSRRIPKHAPTAGGQHSVTLGAGGGWKGRQSAGSFGRPGAGPRRHASAAALPPASSGPTFTAGLAEAVPGGRPMPREGVQRPAPVPRGRGAGRQAGSRRGKPGSSGLSLHGAGAW